MMEDEDFVRLADNNKSLIAACSDPALGMQTVIQDHDVVFGLYPSKDSMKGWEKHRIKGAEHPDATTTAVWCTSINEAMALSRLCGDQAE
jgi:hypothetical protein